MLYPTRWVRQWDRGAGGSHVLRGGQHVHVILVVILVLSRRAVVHTAKNLPFRAPHDTCLRSHQRSLRDNALQTHHLVQQRRVQVARTHHVAAESSGEPNVKGGCQSRL